MAQFSSPFSPRGILNRPIVTGGNRMQDLDRQYWSAAYGRDKATGYEQKRRRQATWHRENAIVKRWSQTVSAGSRVLDLPCGTGRLFPILFQRGISVVGADLSSDMMAEIPSSVRHSPLLEGLVRCDAVDLPYPHRHFDYVVSLRLFHLGTVPKDVQVRMLTEFMRVAAKGVVLHVPLSGRSLVSRLADYLWRAVPWREGPVPRLRAYLARLRQARTRTTDKGGIMGVSRSPARSRGGAWTWPELCNAFHDGGFRIAEAYGAISPLSAKKICVAVRVSKSLP